MTTPTFPLTAWEQAVIVVIFAVVALAVSTMALASMRWLLSWARAREREWQEYIRELRNLDIKARTESQGRTESMMTEVRQALTEMAAAITELTGEFKSHVVDEEARFDVLLTEGQKTRMKANKRRDAS